MSRLMRQYLIVAVTFALLLSEAQGQSSADNAVPGRFLIKLNSSARITPKTVSLAKGQRFTRVSQIEPDHSIRGIERWNRWYTFVSERTDITAEEVVAQLGPENVDYIEQDHYLEFFEFPHDSLFSNQWYLYNTGQSYLGILRKDGNFNDSLVLKTGIPGIDLGISALYADPPVEATRVVIAIIDSGTDLPHPELVNQYWRNPDEIPGNGIDDDHNGFVDDTLGYDVSGDSLALFGFSGDNDPSDNVGHGTHVAGIAAAEGNSSGITGIAPNARIMSVKIRPNATSAIGAAGIIYAVNAGAQVMNLSWGTPFESMILKEALDIARMNGVFAAVAAGNSGNSDKFYPAAFDSVFTVAAGNSSGWLTSFSTYGPAIDIVAPGEDILSLRAAGTDMHAALGEPQVHIIDSLYYIADGTSMAAPMVAGAAAIILSIRPDLNLPDLEDILRLGAVDILDPLNVGDSLPGRDTLSGYGYLSIGNSLNLLANGGLHIVSPIQQNRYVDSVDVLVGTIGGYSGGWTLEYATNPDPQTWQFLASGLSLPFDSVIFSFGSAQPSGHIYLKLTDDIGRSTTTAFILVNENRTELSSPQANQEFEYSIPITGSAYGRDYDSLVVSYLDSTGEAFPLATFTGEFFDSLIYNWNASGLPPGNYTLVASSFYASGIIADSVPFTLKSAFADGWPRTLPGRGGYSAACADLNNDGIKEIAVGTTFGLNLFHADGTSVPGFPILTDYNCRCQPAMYDIDRDGEKEIIFTNELGIFAVNYDGTMAQGWPRLWSMDRLSYGFAQPVITELHNGPLDDSVVICVTNDGTVLAYEFDGDPYFFSQGGWYASFNSYPTSAFFFGGNGVSAIDINGDGMNEVVVSFSATSQTTGVGIYDARIGQPALGPEAYVITPNVIYGTILADLNHDFLPEIITVGYDSSGMRTIWIRTDGNKDLPGWPVTLPAVGGFRGNYPVVADLDLDGTPEVLCTFFEFDISSLYIFRADGSPYIVNEGRPSGEAYVQPVTFGTPIVANLTGDDYPEIVIRSGYILPGTGPEQVYILDHTATPIPGWPVATPARSQRVFSTPFVPLADDIDSDGLMELLLVSEADEVLVWDFDASSNGGKNVGRLFMDNLNSGIYGLGDILTDVTDTPSILPSRFSLEQNYPNPFNPATNIQFSIDARTHTRLDIFNVLGQHVATLIDDELAPGVYTVRFDGAGLASGVYFYRLDADGQTVSRKMVLLK